MSAINRNITIEQGVTFKETRTLYVADPAFPNLRTKDKLMDLTGYLGRSQCRDNNGLGNIICEFIVTIDPITSIVTRDLPATLSSAIVYTTKKLRHDLELYTLNDESVIRLEQGDVTISWEVTK